MIKRVLWIVCFGLFLFSCGKKATYRIEGEISNLVVDTLFAVYEKDNIKLIDTLYSKEKGAFVIEKNEPSFNSVTLFFDEKTHWVTIFLDSLQEVTVAGDALYPELIRVNGGKVNDDLTSFKQKVKHLLKEKEDLTQKLLVGDKTNIEEGDVIAKLTNVKHQLSEAAVEYVRHHPGNMASAVLIRTYFSNLDDTRKMDELLAVLDSTVRKSSLVQEMEQFSTKVKQSAVGADAPDFCVKDILAKELSLSVFNKQYLLLSFAAPWCDICKSEHEYLKDIRKSFPKNKLEMLTITLDMDQDSVRKMAVRDSISWHLVSDSAGHASAMVDLYGVNAIPKNFLIDNAGKIILKTENGAEIEQTLEKLMKK